MHNEQGSIKTSSNCGTTQSEHAVHTEVRFGQCNLKAVLPSESLALQPLLYFQSKYRSPSTFIKELFSLIKANSRTSQGLLQTTGN